MPFKEFNDDYSQDNFSDVNAGLPTRQKASIQNMVTSIGECSFRCIKITFSVFNLFLCIVAFVIVFMAVELSMSRGDIANSYARDFPVNGYVNAPTVLLVIGVVTLSLSFLACFGSRKNNKVMISVYTVLLLLVTAAECGMVLLMYSYREKVDSTLHNDLKTQLNFYGQDYHESVTASIDSLQRHFKCCGVQNYMDWFETKWWQMNNGSFNVPQSCCVFNRIKNCNRDITSSNLDMIFSEGCYKDVRKYLLENIHIISGFGVWIIVLECLGVIFSLVLIIKIRKEERFMQESKYDKYGGDGGSTENY